MTVLILLLIAICSFLFFGVVGEDKTWLLAPAITLSLGLVATWWVRESVSSFRATGASGGGRSRLASANDFPISTWLWVVFLLFGILMVPQAVVPFEAKIKMLQVSAVVGAYMVWGRELTAFKDNRIVLGFLIFVVMLCALYGLILHFKAPDSILWTTRYTDAYEGRLRSTYICPNHFAHLMQMLLPFCLVFLFIPQAGIYLKMLSGYTLLAFMPTLFLTESRAGWLGAMAAVGVTLCLMALRRSKALFISLVILVPLCSFLLLFAGWRYSETFQRRATPVVEFLQGQAEGGVGSEAKDFRPQTWMDTVELIKEAPLLGHGPGNYRYTYPEYRERFRGHRIVTGHPHNEYLELMADFGLIGFVLFAVAWCWGGIWILNRALKAEEARHAFIGFAFIGTMAGTMVHSFFDFEMAILPNAMVFALLAATACGPLHAVTERLNRRERRERRKRKDLLGAEDGGSHTVQQGTQREPLQNDASSDTEDMHSRLTSIQQLRFHARKAGAWLLALGYLVLTVFSIKVMGSDYIQALGDRARDRSVNIGHMKVMEDHPSPEYYKLAARIDPQNWQAHKHMGLLLSDRRYYSLDMNEMMDLAAEERSWLERARVANPKEPENLIALGKALIFLGKHEAEDSGQLSVARVFGGTTAVSSTGTEASAPPPNNQHLSAVAAAKEEPVLNNSLHSAGLDCLREAGLYRKFNDKVWWTLGVELREAGRYDEALEIFEYAAGIRGTPSIRANIAWIKKRMANRDTESTDSVAPVESMGQLFDLFDQPVQTNSTDELEGLFDLMEERD